MLRRLLVAALALTAAPALANDSTAELGTGGLILSRSDQISMDSEDLFISMDKVTVDYVFSNRSEQDVDTIVAFPMPDIEANPYMNISVPDDQSDNFLGFTVVFDGKPVKPELEQRAFAAGIDITEELKARKIPLFPFGDGVAKALEALPADVAADWQVRGIVTQEEYDEGAGMKKVNSPFWQMRSTYWWRAVFPAGRSVKVAHRYTPSLGGTSGLNFFLEGKAQGATFQDYKSKYCIEDSLLRTIARAGRENADGYPPFNESRLSYVLTSGGNWALGTIGKFKLTIDKGDPENLLSFCGQNVEKVGPTTFRMTAEDYYPARDIDILILQRLDAGDSYDPTAKKAN